MMEGAILAGNGWIGRRIVVEMVIFPNVLLSNCWHLGDLIILLTRRTSKLLTTKLYTQTKQCRPRGRHCTMR